MKRTIIALVGDSGSGKTYASFYLQLKFHWNAIVSFTTRPMREGEINGKEHWFVDKSRVPDKSKMFAYTQFGGYEYWAELKQFLAINPYVYVIDEKGLIDLKSNKDLPFQFKLITIKINRDNKDGIDKDRQERDKERIYIPDESYDYVINNNGSVEEFHVALYTTAMAIKCNKLY